MSRLLAWLVVWGLWGCVDTPPPAPPTEGTVCLSTVLEERAEGDALALLAPPPYRPSCQYSHPADYWAHGCEGPDALCSYCELASMAYHNRAAELGCCREWVCSWTGGRTPEDAARAFDAAQTCTELQTARHPVTAYAYPGYGGEGACQACEGHGGFEDADDDGLRWLRCERCDGEGMEPDVCGECDRPFSAENPPATWTEPGAEPLVCCRACVTIARLIAQDDRPTARPPKRAS